MSDPDERIRKLEERIEKLERQVALLSRRVKPAAAGGNVRDFRDRFDALDYPER